MAERKPWYATLYTGDRIYFVDLGLCATRFFAEAEFSQRLSLAGMPGFLLIEHGALFDRYWLSIASIRGVTFTQGVAPDAS